MTDEPRTRHLDADELTRALDAFRDDAVAARPIRVTREPATKRVGEPSTTLGMGVPRQFELPRASLPPPRASVPSTEPSRALEASSQARTSVPAPHAQRGVRAWHAWLAGIVLAGLALAGLIALHLNVTRATARVPSGTLRMPPALPAGVPVTTPLDVPAPPRVEAMGPASATRRSAVDALLAGRTRVALEHYRRVLQQPELADREAIEGIVKVLARELRSCEQEAGTPCGF